MVASLPSPASGTGVRGEGIRTIIFAFQPTLMDDQRFPKACHIRRGADFQRAYRRRCAAADGQLKVFGCENDLPFARLGLSVSRQVGRAVVRNRWKRLIREAFRLSRDRLPTGVDLVVIPQSGAKAELAAIIDSLRRLANRVVQKLTRP